MITAVGRPPSSHVRLVREKLIARLGDGIYRGGDRFFSARAIASHFGISYQTADRLLQNLVDAGRLVRRAGSGTYVAGGATPSAVALIFDRRARRAGSFGARLVHVIEHRFRQEGIAFTTTWATPEKAARLASTQFAVVWECPATVAGMIARGMPGLILNDRPGAGLSALLLDSVAVDDFLGGACAGELIQRRLGRQARVGVLAGPKSDRRSNERVRGFVAKHPHATIDHAQNWYAQDASSPAEKVLSRRPAAIFACNDRLAQAVLDAARRLLVPTPMIYGFDDAPVAEELHLSTIAIPWTAVAEAVAAIVRRRLSGENGPTSHQLLSPRPINRLT